MCQDGIKRPFLLVEAVIAFSIALIILSVGATLIYSCLHIQKRSTEQFQEALYKRALTTRLRTFLSSFHYRKGKKPLVVYRENKQFGERLLFAGDNGTFRVASLANTVLYYLFVDEEGLKLAIHSDPERKQMNQSEEAVYLIWPKAKQVTFRFLGKKNLSDQSLEWTNEWNENESPLAIEATIESQGSDAPIRITSLVAEAVSAKKPLKVQISSDQIGELLSKGQKGTFDDDSAKEEK